MQLQLLSNAGFTFQSDFGTSSSLRNYWYGIFSVDCSPPWKDVAIGHARFVPEYKCTAPCQVLVLQRAKRATFGGSLSMPCRRFRKHAGDASRRSREGRRRDQPMQCVNWVHNWDYRCSPSPVTEVAGRVSGVRLVVDHNAARALRYTYYHLCLLNDGIKLPVRPYPLSDSCTSPRRLMNQDDVD